MLEGWSTDSCKNFFGQMITSDARALQNLACSASVFFGRANFFLAKAHVETRKEGREWGESKGAG